MLFESAFRTSVPNAGLALVLYATVAVGLGAGGRWRRLPRPAVAMSAFLGQLRNGHHVASAGRGISNAALFDRQVKPLCAEMLQEQGRASCSLNLWGSS